MGRQTKSLIFVSQRLRKLVGEEKKGEKKRKRRKKRKKRKEMTKKVGFHFWNHVFFGFLGFLVWIIGPLYGFPWFLGF